MHTPIKLLNLRDLKDFLSFLSGKKTQLILKLLTVESSLSWSLSEQFIPDLFPKPIRICTFAVHPSMSLYWMTNSWFLALNSGFQLGYRRCFPLSCHEISSIDLVYQHQIHLELLGDISVCPIFFFRYFFLTCSQPCCRPPRSSLMGLPP